MRKFGYVRVGAAVPIIEVGNCVLNAHRIIELVNDACKNNVEIIVFPELCITGYTCGDLFYQKTLIIESENSVRRIAKETENTNIVIVLGVCIKSKYNLYNCAVVLYKGKILCAIPKTAISNKDGSNEKRWFTSSIFCHDQHIKFCDEMIPFGVDILLQHEIDEDICVGIEISQDLNLLMPPSYKKVLFGANIILNLSACDDYVGKGEKRVSTILAESNKLSSAYIMASAGFGESTTDSVYGGHCIIAETGKLLEETERYVIDKQLIFADIDIEKLNTYKHKNFLYEKEADLSLEYRKINFNTKLVYKTIKRKIEKYPFVPIDNKTKDIRCNDVYRIQTVALCKIMKHVNTKGLVIGISGGLDSTLALLVCTKACDLLKLDRKIIKAVTMPGFGTTDRTYNNAVNLIHSLGVEFSEISIKDACLQHFKDIGHDIKLHNVAYENAQARERTQILMDIANDIDGLVIGTGDLSELALGWATYNGDHMSMYGVNSSVPKTLIRYIVKWIADNECNENSKNILYDILDTPVSPELLPPDMDGKILQKTEELVGPYELHDFFLYHIIKYGYRPEKIYYLAKSAFSDIYSNEILLKWIKNFYKRFFSQQYKRSCVPAGPKVGSVGLSPRGSFIMPNDASAKMWLDEIENINID